MFLNSNTYHIEYGWNLTHLTNLQISNYEGGVLEESNKFLILRQFFLFLKTVKSKLRFRFKKKPQHIRNLNFRLKVVRRRFKKHKPVRTKFMYNRFVIMHTPLVKSYKKFKHKIRKVDIRRPFKIILKSRRLLRILWSAFKLRSNKLTTRLLQIFHKRHVVKNSKLLTIPTILVTLGMATNILDASYWVANKFVTVNSRSTTNNGYCVNTNDIIYFTRCIFAAKYSYYFKLSYLRWLRWKKRRITKRLSKFTNYNVAPLTIKKILKRWLATSKVDRILKINCEVDYRACLAFVFHKRSTRVNRMHLSSIHRPLGILHLWYYKF